MTKTNSTTDQLRALMTRHTATMAAASPAPAATPPVVTITATATRPIVSTPKAPKPASPLTEDKAPERCTVRLIASEIARVNAIMLETHQMTGKPITASDVLRIGLRRVGEKTPITPEEIAALRATDGRRTRATVRSS